MRLRITLALLTLAAVLPPAHAQQIFDPNAITLRHDFNTQPPNAPPPGPFSLGDATFSEASFGSGSPGWRLISVWPGFGRQLTDNAGISDITIAFAQPMLLAGLHVGIGNATYNVDFFSGNTLVGSVRGTVTGVDGNFFAGWMHAGGITRIRITEPSGENGLVGGIDDVRYDVVPEPTTMAVLAVAGAFLIRRRRKA